MRNQPLTDGSAEGVHLEKRAVIRQARACTVDHSCARQVAVVTAFAERGGFEALGISRNTRPAFVKLHRAISWRRISPPAGLNPEIGRCSWVDSPDAGKMARTPACHHAGRFDSWRHSTAAPCRGRMKARVPGGEIRHRITPARMGATGIGLSNAGRDWSWPLPADPWRGPGRRRVQGTRRGRAAAGEGHRGCLAAGREVPRAGIARHGTDEAAGCLARMGAWKHSGMVRKIAEEPGAPRNRRITNSWFCV